MSCGDLPTIPVCLCALMGVFDDHADKKTSTLSKQQLKGLLKEHMGMCTEKGNDAQLQDMFDGMDADGDGQVNFKEFMMFLAHFACICHGRNSGM